MSTPQPSCVFGCDTYETALARWKRSRDPEKRAVAVNLSCEHRVPPEQEAEFRHFFRPLSPDPREQDRALRAALDDYVEEMVRPELPARRLGINLVADCLGGQCCEGFDMDADLANVLNLSRLMPVLKVAANSTREEWKPLRDVPIPDVTRPYHEYDEWLDRNLEGKSPQSDEVKNFVEAVFSVLRFSRATKGPYNPTWVTTWEKFEPFAEELAGGMRSPDRWNQVVGVGTLGDQWQIVLRYPARKAGRIFRPTQLDGGSYPYHFPSPAAAGMGLGGHPMDLSGPAPTQALLPEYIHEQIEPDISYWINAGRLLGRTAGEDYSLPELRRRHHERLKGQYGEGVAEWMPRPV
ncbi:MAG TPA: hypothetical protein VF508_11840 [Pyrinomonadaceae bacterium]